MEIPKNIKTLGGHPGRVHCLCHVGATVWSGSNDGCVLVHDAASGEYLVTLRVEGDAVRALCLVRGYVWVGTSKGPITVFNPQTGQAVTHLIGHSGAVTALSMSEDECQVWSASADSTVRCWDSDTGDLLRVVTGHRGLVRAVLVVGPHVWSAGDDHVVRVWSAHTGTLVSELRGHQAVIHSLCRVNVRGGGGGGGTVDTLEIWSSAADATIQTYDADALRPLRTIRASTSATRAWICSLCAVPVDGQRVLVFAGGSDRVIRIYDATVAGKDPVHVLRGHKGMVSALALVGQHVWSGAGDGCVKIWNVRDPLNVPRFIPPRPVPTATVAASSRPAAAQPGTPEPISSTPPPRAGTAVETWYSNGRTPASPFPATEPNEQPPPPPSSHTGTSNSGNISSIISGGGPPLAHSKARSNLQRENWRLMKELEKERLRADRAEQQQQQQHHHYQFNSSANETYRHGHGGSVDELQSQGRHQFHGTSESGDSRGPTVSSSSGPSQPHPATSVLENEIPGTTSVADILLEHGIDSSKPLRPDVLSAVVSLDAALKQAGHDLRRTRDQLFAEQAKLVQLQSDTVPRLEQELAMERAARQTAADQYAQQLDTVKHEHEQQLQEATADLQRNLAETTERLDEAFVAQRTADRTIARLREQLAATEQRLAQTSAENGALSSVTMKLRQLVHRSHQEDLEDLEQRAEQGDKLRRAAAASTSAAVAAAAAASTGSRAAPPTAAAATPLFSPFSPSIGSPSVQKVNSPPSAVSALTQIALKELDARLQKSSMPPSPFNETNNGATNPLLNSILRHHSSSVHDDGPRRWTPPFTGTTAADTVRGNTDRFISGNSLRAMDESMDSPSFSFSRQQQQQQQHRTGLLWLDELNRASQEAETRLEQNKEQFNQINNSDVERR